MPGRRRPPVDRRRVQGRTGARRPEPVADAQSPGPRPTCRGLCSPVEWLARRLRRSAMKNLRDRRVIVTGAASGIGRGTALAFAMEGCRLVLVDIDEGGLASVESEVRAIGAECSSFIVDVTDAAQVERLATTLGESGGVDVLSLIHISEPTR